MNRRRLLLVPNCGIGDTFMALPLADKIKSRVPDLHVTVVVNGETNFRIARAYESVDECICLSGADVLIQGNLKGLMFKKSIERAALESDLVILLVNIPFYRDIAARVLSGKLLFWKDEYLDEGEPIYHGFQRMVNENFGWEREWVFTTTPSFDEKLTAFADRWKEEKGLAGIRTAALILKAESASKAHLKDIPPVTVERIIDFVAAKGYRPWVVLPPDIDSMIYGPLLEKTKVPVACYEDIMQPMALLKSSDLVIGPDTGLMHFAALDGKRTISLFGHSSRIFTPAADRGAVIDKGADCDQRCIPSEKCASHQVSCLAGVTGNDLDRALAQIVE